MILLPQLLLGLSLAIHEPINRLVLELGSRDFRTREAASSRLAAIGEPALDILYTAKRSIGTPKFDAAPKA